jgi:hypothetical protein
MVPCGYTEYAPLFLGKHLDFYMQACKGNIHWIFVLGIFLKQIFTFWISSINTLPLNDKSLFKCLQLMQHHRFGNK